MNERGAKYVPPEIKDDNLEPFVVHPDVTYATKNYDGSRRSFKKMREIRAEARAKAEEYWESDHDEEMRETAKVNTHKASASGWRFPKIGRREK